MLFFLYFSIFQFNSSIHFVVGEKYKPIIQRFSWMIYAMMSLIIDIMFEEERKKATFDNKELSYIIYGSKKEFEDFLERQRLIDSDPILKFDPSIIQRSRRELLNIYAKKHIRYSQIFPHTDLHHGEKNLFFEEQFPLGLHDFMFLITLRNLCDDQQRRTILQPAERGEILGCYAQTELGHGSDVQSLMTTATYDEETQNFVLNTPEIKAAKWWIGDLGVFCTHACVFAQLVIKGKNHGVHAFLVPIRDQNHKVFAGLEVGDVGPKVGFNTKDNGYLIMKNYRIPRQNMLMKYQKVTRQGKYSISGNEKVTYATMLMIRSVIPYLTYVKTSKAIMILTRYSLFRRQFKDNKGVDIPVLDYQLQQEKIFPRIAQVFAILFSFKVVLELSSKVLSDAQQNKFDQLQEAHLITSSVKALSTKDSLKGLQTLRRAGGGHGYSWYSGLPGLQNELSPTYTFEGEYTILQLQVARYLLKNVDRALKGKSLSQSVAYILRFSETVQQINTEDQALLTNPQTIIKIFEQHSLQRIKKAAQRMQNGMQNGMKLKNVWDQFSGLQLIDAATAHGYTLVIKYYWMKIQELAKSQGLKSVLIDLFLLYATQRISEYSSSFYQTSVLGATSLKTIRGLREKLLAKIRPNALSIVQAFAYSDDNLHTAIGRSNGRAYQTLYDWAKNKNDVNKPQVLEQINKLALQMQSHTTKIMKARL